MYLDGQQTKELADVIANVMTPAALDLFAGDLGVDLAKIGAPADLKERAFTMIQQLGKEMPPRHFDLLEELSRNANANLREVARKLLQPAFFSPNNGDALRAIVLGKIAFIARDALREGLREFTNPSLYSTRVLIVRGEEPGGKSYSWEFLRHLAFSVGATPRRLGLKGTGYTPREFFQQAYLLLGLNPAALLAQPDDPSLAKIDSLINDFKGRMVTLSRRYWLVVDDLNDPSVTPHIRDAAFAIAYAAEELKPDDLWVALLGYNQPTTNPDLRYIASDYAEFPTPAYVAEHLKLVSTAHPPPVSIERARQIANFLFAKFPKLDKEAMSRLTVMVEQAGEKLKRGQQP